MTYIPPTQTFLDVSQSTSDGIFTNNRKITAGNNAQFTDGGAASTFTVQVNKTTSISGDTTVTSASNTNIYADATSAGITVTLPAASTTDKKFLVKKIDSSGNTVTITRAGSDTIEGSNTVVLSAQYQWLVIQSDGTATWKVVGRTVPSSGIAPSNSQYVLLATDSNLTNSRVLTAGNNVVLTDAGAGSTVTVNVHKKTAVSGNTTVTNASNMIYLVDATGGAVAITLPAASNTDKNFIVKKIDSSSNAVTITRAGSDTIDGATTNVLSVQYQATSIVADGSTSWYVL